MNILLMSVTLIATIVLAMAFGIAGGYYAIVGILYSLNRNTRPAAVLVPNTGSTGD